MHSALGGGDTATHGDASEEFQLRLAEVTATASRRRRGERSLGQSGLAWAWWRREAVTPGNTAQGSVLVRR